MVFKIVSPEIISMKKFQPTEHPQIYLCLDGNEVCVINRKYAVVIYMDSS